MGRNWVFTICNPNTDDLLKRYTECKILIAVLELSESGMKHYQGYLELTASRTLAQVKSLFNDVPHLEPRAGTQASAIAYCLKTVPEDLCNSMPLPIDSLILTTIVDMDHIWNGSLLTPVIIRGPWKTYSELKGFLTAKRLISEDLSLIQDKLNNGATIEDIADDHFDLWVKYNSAFTKYILLKSKPRTWKTTLTVIVGPTGTGKSKYCADKFPDAYWKPRGQWWDGYERQQSVVIDEFYGWLQYDTLLRLGDRYPYYVEIKGGTINFEAKDIVITSNKRPDQWYNNVYFDSFIRRVETWIYMESLDNAYSYTDYNLFIKHFD